MRTIRRSVRQRMNIPRRKDRPCRSPGNVVLQRNSQHSLQVRSQCSWQRSRVRRTRAGGRQVCDLSAIHRAGRYIKVTYVYEEMNVYVREFERDSCESNYNRFPQFKSYREQSKCSRPSPITEWQTFWLCDQISRQAKVIVQGGRVDTSGQLLKKGLPGRVDTSGTKTTIKTGKSWKCDFPRRKIQNREVDLVRRHMLRRGLNLVLEPWSVTRS